MTHALLRLVTVGARMTTELEELQRTQNSPSLWSLHARCAGVLLEIERSVRENVKRVLVSTETEGGVQSERSPGIDPETPRLHRPGATSAFARRKGCRRNGRPLITANSGPHR